jgi:hypothetical protein
MSPNINNPGGTKNDPAEILDALTSDSTEFPGANIDATVSSRATPADTGLGIDWSAKTPRHDVAGSNTLGNFLTVSGSGYILGFVSLGDNTGAGTTLAIDGTDIITHQQGDSKSDMDTGEAAQINRANPSANFFKGVTNQTNCLFRFDSSFAARNNSGQRQQAEVTYVLD